MKRFNQLTPSQQSLALAHELTSILQGILEGILRFDVDGAIENDDLQARIDAALASTKTSCRQPRFARECILDACREDLMTMARAQAEDAWYLEPGEDAIRLSALDAAA
jgi:hypothetical protein